jgi:hypothetical protein
VGKLLPTSRSCGQSQERYFDYIARMSSILPKGIVVNTPEISSDIQKIDREPLAVEEIAKLWKGKRANGCSYIITLSLIKTSIYHYQEKAS